MPAKGADGCLIGATERRSHPAAGHLIAHDATATRLCLQNRNRPDAAPPPQQQQPPPPAFMQIGELAQSRYSCERDTCMPIRGGALSKANIETLTEQVTMIAESCSCRAARQAASGWFGSARRGTAPISSGATNTCAQEHN